ncbi:cobalamin B12-binding domain-containing protein [Sinanaerobacter chloroacetimidivorans]|uniref:Corrinoid protein n=1 Tax=Sinanaerobacter chloroacetimidivorans TaxID=2818044 RepID=A0A8J7W497_9FIRM|nr:corrinoid protein [Sinanaerobacter chloroacetimidivorans]MBR0598801.1 corrinoid protein [Sinanaerobacter chloroacetimidivorans]
MTKETLFKDAFDSIVDCDEDKAMEVIKAGEEMGIDPVELLTEGFSAGIKHLGDLFGRGEVFLPELIFSTEVMKVVTAEIESKMDHTQVESKGVMVIGTVAGDVHDIGKGIVASLVKTNGIEVHDLGREVPAEVFIEKIKEYNADFVGSSALLTTTMTEQKKIEELLEKEGLKGKVKSLIGGAPVTKRWAEKIGADAYCEDASDTVNFILNWIGEK